MSGEQDPAAALLGQMDVEREVEGDVAFFAPSDSE